MGLVRRFVPKRLQGVCLRGVDILKKVFYFGCARYCPVCRSHLRGFRRHSILRESKIVCPVCATLDRHRFVWVFLKRNTNLFGRKSRRVLHVAPEMEFEKKLKAVKGLDYLSGDLENRAMVKMDITDIAYDDESFDAIICCHVLEHVRADRKAMSEFYRVLKPGGWAVIQVPQPPDVLETVEDDSITDPEERHRVFGWPSHVRIYGPDLKDRLEEAGFRARRFSCEDIATARETAQYGISGQKLYHAVKPE